MIATPSRQNPWYHSHSFKAHGHEWQFTYSELSAQRIIENSDRSCIVAVSIKDTTRHDSPQQWLDHWLRTKGKKKLEKFIRGNQQPCSDTSIFSQELAVLPLQQNDSESVPSSSSRSTPTHKPYCDRTGQIYPSTTISEPITPTRENLTLLPAASHAQAHQTLESGKDSTTQNQPCGEKGLDASLNVSLDSLLLSNLQELSTEDLEQYLAQSEWLDIVSRAKLSQRRSLEQDTVDPDCLLFPTLTSCKGDTNRPAGQTRCESFFKGWNLITNGSQLSAGAMALIMGYPSNWFEALKEKNSANATTPNLPTPQDESAHDTSPDEQLHPIKQRSLSAASYTCPHCQQTLLKLEDGCGVCGWLPEILLGENSTTSGRPQISPNKKSPKKNPSGSLYPFLQNKTDKQGNVKSYPKVTGERDPNNPSHWCWAYCWDEKVKTEKGEKWRTCKRSVRLEVLEEVKTAIADNQPVSEILTIIGPKKKTGRKSATDEQIREAKESDQRD